MVVLAVLFPVGASAQVARPDRPASDQVIALWMRAVGLMRDGDPAAALPLLHSLHEAMPQSAPVKLELALAHYRLQQDALSRRLFQEAMSMELSVEERDAAGRYLARLQARRSWAFDLSAGMMPQSNASRRTAADRIKIGGFDFVLDDRAESGTGANFRASASYRAPAGPGARPGFGAAFYGKFFENEEWNDFTLALDAHLAFGEVATGQTTAGVLVRPRWLSDRPYTLDVGAYVSHALRVGEQTAVSLRVEWLERLSKTEGRRDAQVTRVGLIVGHELSSATSIRAGAIVSRTDAPAASEAMTGLTANFGISHQISDWRISLDASVLRERRDGPSPVFGVTRDETEQQIRLGLANRNISVMGFSPVLELGREERRSNVSLYSWTNTYAGISFARSF